ncbi:MAG: hypothetical protein CME17_10870 [Gemmatimonadetes bacterium]|nr:hypothetical protein [Gemmatimonadota bacterium]
MNQTQQCYQMLDAKWRLLRLKYPELPEQHGIRIEYFANSRKGGYVKQGNFETIWLNSDFLNHHGQDFIDRTVPHELAHIVDQIVNGMAYTRTMRRVLHGPSWRAIMRDMGCDPKRCHSYDQSASGRIKQLFVWENEGGELMPLTPIRHKRMLKCKPGRGYYRREHQHGTVYHFTGRVQTVGGA